MDSQFRIAFMFTKKFFLSLVFSLTGFYLVNAAADFYTTYPNFDVPMHFLGGMVAAIFFVLYFKKELSKLSPLLIAVFLIGSTIFAGIIWEFFEWGLDHFLVPYVSWMRISQLGLEDTLGDIFVDFLGGTAIFLLYLYEEARKSNV